MRTLLTLTLLALAPSTSALPQLDDVDQLIFQGRELLDHKKPKDAEGVFLQAQQLDGGTLKTRMWVLRAWMDQGGRNNDTLNAIDDLASVHDGPDMDYLYGMAFARRGEEHLAQGLANTVQMNFMDAVVFLKRSTLADPVKYRDAFLPLARASWFNQELDDAREAIETAVRYYPDDPETMFEFGTIALSQFVATQADATQVSLSERHWEAARDAFGRAAELAGKPTRKDLRLQSLKAQSYLQHGHTLMWKKQAKLAKESYAQALVWNPTSVDLGQLFGTLGNRDLNEVLEEASPAFTKRAGKKDLRDATMLWWLGYTRYYERKRKESEEAFLAALEKAPTFVNAWNYIGLARYDQKDYEGALEAFKAGWDVEPSAMIAEMLGDRDMNIARVEFVIGWCVERERWADAAVLAELCAETARDVARYWNNLGFFLREEGARVAGLPDDEEAAKADDLFEASYDAYTRAVELDDEDPVYLNDTAVILHYYLGRDFDQALAWYDRAAELAQEQLDAGGMARDKKELVRTALRDATNNRRDLKRLLKEIRAEEATEKAGKGS